MIPSRGLRWSSQTIGLGRRRDYVFSKRQFSSVVQTSPVRGHPLLSITTPTVSRLRMAAQTSRATNLIRNGTSIRFASTVPTSPLSTASTTATPSEILSSSEIPQSALGGSFEELLDVTKETLHSTPEQIGYLKSLGLDYGWGPTGMMEWTLEHVHVLAGTPWWLSITLTAILVRAVMFKPYIDAAENSAKMAAVAHITKPITAQINSAKLAGDTQRASVLTREMMQVYRRAGIKMWKGFVPMLQVFAGYGTFVLLRAMGKLPVPGLETGGILWFHNLTYSDPYMLLPVATAGVLHWVLRKGGEMGVSNFSPPVYKMMMYGLPCITLVATSFLPAAVQLSFFVSGVLAFCQSTLFRQTWFRAYFNMTPLPKKSNLVQEPAAAQSPYQGTLIRKADIPTAGTTVKTQPAALRQGANALRDGNQSKGVLSGTVKDIMGTYEGARKTISEALNMEARKTKAEKAQAQRYEERKREALKKEKARKRSR